MKNSTNTRLDFSSNDQETANSRSFGFNEKFSWRSKIILFLLVSVGLLNFSVNPVKANQHLVKQIQKVSAPTIIDFNQYSTQNKNKPFLTGVSAKNTDVMVYINGQYVENASVNTTNTETNNFYYFPNKELPAGTHEVMLIAKDRTSLLLSAPTEIKKFTIQKLPAPTLISPTETSVISHPKPIITGLTKSGSFVHVYIDGVYNGKTEARTHQSGTADFAYTPFLNLKPGWHTVWVKAEDSSGKKSEASKVMRFQIEYPYPAPTTMEPVVNNATTYNQPYITGLTKNDSKVRVYINQRMVGEFSVKNHPSGTANFAFKSPELTEGRHLVYTTAVDSRGKESRWSNLVYFNVVKPVVETPETEKDKTSTDTSDKDKTKDPLIIDKTKETDDQGKIIDSVKEKVDDEDKPSTGDSDLDDIIRGGEDQEEKGGLVDESKNNQGKLEWNLIIFLLFLLAVIVWIFWVNRELIKERREKKDTEGDSDNS